MPVQRRNVHSIAKNGSTQLNGDVTLTGGANVTLTQSGNDISIASTGGGGGGGGDMLASVYDPNSVANDAFDQDNMVDGTTNKNYTATEKTKLAGIASGATANTGDVVGPASSTDSNLAAFDGTTGKLLKDTPIQVDTFDGSFNLPAATASVTVGDLVGSPRMNTNDLTTWSGTTITVGNTLDIDTGIALQTDTISEHTAASGVTIDGVLLKDGAIAAGAVPTLNQNTTGSAAKLTTGRTIALTGDVTYTSPSFDGTGNVTAASTVTKINGTALSGLATGILKNTTATGVPSIAIAADFPTLNQTTTGSAATLTTSRTVRTDLASTSTASFNGSANITPGVTGTLAVGNGGTGVTSSTGSTNVVLSGSPTITTPTIDQINASSSSHLTLNAGTSKLVKTSILRQTNTTDSYKTGNTVMLTGISSVSNGSNKTVTFGITFAAIPVVLVSNNAGNSSSATFNYPATSNAFADRVFGAYSQSTTGFTVQVSGTAPTASQIIYFSWTAIGEI